MKVTTSRIAEIVGISTVVLSLIFVGVELRQSTIASRAAAYQELGFAATEYWYLMANNRELNDMFWRVGSEGSENYHSLSDSDRQLLLSLTIGSIRRYETVWLQVEQGLLQPEALDSFGYEGFRNSGQLRIMWCDVRGTVTQSFATYLESSGLGAC